MSAEKIWSSTQAELLQPTQTVSLVFNFGLEPKLNNRAISRRVRGPKNTIYFNFDGSIRIKCQELVATVVGYKMFQLQQSTGILLGD